MKIAAVTCARMDSTRFYGKCLATFRGKPLLQHTIDVAKEVGWPLYVMTYDPIIMRYVSAQCPIIFEPEQFYAQRQEGLAREMMRYVNDIVGADVVVLLQPTHPVRDARVLREWTGVFCNRRGTRGCSTYVTLGKTTESGSLYAYSAKYLLTGVDDNPVTFAETRPLDIDRAEDMEAGCAQE